MPRWPPAGASMSGPLHPWREVLFSERGTLLAVVVMSGLLILKHAVWL
jgi:hypothetical protein